MRRTAWMLSLVNMKVISILFVIRNQPVSPRRLAMHRVGDCLPK